MNKMIVFYVDQPHNINNKKVFSSNDEYVDLDLEYLNSVPHKHTDFELHSAMVIRNDRYNILKEKQDDEHVGTLFLICPNFYSKIYYFRCGNEDVNIDSEKWTMVIVPLSKLFSHKGLCMYETIAYRDNIFCSRTPGLLNKSPNYSGLTDEYDRLYKYHMLEAKRMKEEMEKLVNGLMSTRIELAMLVCKDQSIIRVRDDEANLKGEEAILYNKILEKYPYSFMTSVCIEAKVISGEEKYLDFDWKYKTYDVYSFYDDTSKKIRYKEREYTLFKMYNVNVICVQGQEYDD